MKRMPAPASRNSFYFLLIFFFFSPCCSTIWRENNYCWGGSRGKKKISPFRIPPPLHQWSQFLLRSSNNNTFVGLCVTSHDSIKNRWINNETNGRWSVALHGSASSPLHRKAPYSLGQMHNSCIVGMQVRVGNAQRWWEVVHTSESEWEIFVFVFFWLSWLEWTHSISSLPLEVLDVTRCSVHTLIWYGARTWTCNTGFQPFPEDF